MNEFFVKGFKTTIIDKPSFETIGFSRFLYCSDGCSIGIFLKELTDSGQMDKLAGTLDIPQQIWVCLSGNGGHPDSDCRCTICVEKSEKHKFSRFKEDELFSLSAPASKWANFEVGEEQSPTELHGFDVYKMVKEIGYMFNGKVGFHLDNEHEWEPGKKMKFLLPVVPV